MTEREKKERFNTLSRIGCIVCRVHHGIYTPPIIHHLCGLDSTREGLGGKADDRETLPLCPNHHQHGGKGISYHDAPEQWEKKYGTQMELLAMVNGIIERTLS